jgi:spermidine synthase
MQKNLYLAVFISGMTSLAVEMSASRLLGNFFGTSNLVWASIIGLILIYLAAGYFLGGFWADRSPEMRTFFTILIWASLLIALVPVASRPVLRWAADAFDQLQVGSLAGSFSAVIILLSIPITLLGTASPFAIRLSLHDTQKSGSVAGKIYAISTLGSFLGTFLPSLVLIPLIGTYRTFLLFSGILMLVSFLGLWKFASRRTFFINLWMPILVIILAIWGLPGTDKNTRGQLYETESSYNYIQVLQLEEYRYLRLNEGQGVHSVYHPSILNYYGPWEQVTVAPFFNPAPYEISNVKDIAIVGLAAGTTARQAAIIYDGVQIDGFEIDPKIVQVGRDYFDMHYDNLNVIVQDGRWGLEHSTKSYQIISIDAYRPPYIPWHLTTQEFFQIVYDHLSADGVMVINIGRAPGNRRLINTLGSTILTVFPSAYVMDIPNTFNSILFATAQPTKEENLSTNMLFLSQNTSVHPLLLETMQITLQNLQPPPLEDIIFTDDVAPIEWITNNMVLDYLLFEH